MDLRFKLYYVDISCIQYTDLYLVLRQLGEDPPLEDGELLPGAGVALPDDGDDVDLVVQPPHELHIHTTHNLSHCPTIDLLVNMTFGSRKINALKVKTTMTIILHNSNLRRPCPEGARK